MSRKRAWYVLAVLALLGIGTSAYGYEVGPFRIILVPSQGQRSASISINNTDPEPLRVEIRAQKRIVSENGDQTFVPADDDFIIFPEQTEVAPGKSQAVRFQYSGPPIGDVSEAYVIQVIQLPVTDPGFSGIRLTYNFGVAVYLDPPRARAKYAVETVNRTETGVRLVIRNSGNSYGLINTRRIVATSGGKTVDLTPDILGARVANPLLPPKATRTFDIAIPEWAETPDTTATVRLLDANG